MDKTTIELTPQQKQNLLIFLNRTNLSGTEVPAFLELMQVINNQPSKTEQSEPSV